ncbi:MAG: hypothetical protein ABIR17_09120 [Pseudolysinimonas sp.]
MHTSTANSTHRTPRTKIALAALLVALALVFVNVTPAYASTAAIHGSQTNNSTVFWATARTNSFASNLTSINPYNGTNIGSYPFTAGMRNSSANVSSFAKTATMQNLPNASFFRLIVSQSQHLPYGMFWLTTSYGFGSCGCDFGPTWSGTLVYNISG